jgi:hypothetical protein
MTAVPVDGLALSPMRRATALVVLGVSVAAGGTAITMLSLTMRSVTEIGGSCADGGPYVSAQACPSGTGTALLLVFAGTFVFVIGTLWAGSVLHAPMPLWLSWPALFLTLGWNFLEDGVDPPMGEGIVVGFVVCGVLFVLMGATPLLIWASVARGNRRTHRALDAARAGATTTVPAPRRQSGAATLDEEAGR